MSTETVTKWKLIHKCPKGHKYFTKDVGTVLDGNTLYIADESGSNPDTTDDGPLRVDRTKKIRAIKDHFLIPVIAERNDTASSTGAYPSEALWLAARLNMLIVTEDGKTYSIA
jgi:hypothetical protein